METILDYAPTAEELAQMEMNFKWSTPQEYLDLLEQRAKFFDTSVDYERVCDLRDLAKIRKNMEHFKRFTRYLEEDLGDIHDRQLYE